MTRDLSSALVRDGVGYILFDPEVANLMLPVVMLPARGSDVSRDPSQQVLVGVRTLLNNAAWYGTPLGGNALSSTALPVLGLMASARRIVRTVPGR